MCDHTPPKNLATHLSKPGKSQSQSSNPNPKPKPSSVELMSSIGSRRRRIWDLPYQCHCPVIGVCLPLHTLRNLANKALGGKVMTDDYEIHVGAVAECVHRNRLSELIQDELERRYEREIKAYRLAKTTKAVADMWAVAVHQGEAAGAFWAALTHPRCDEVLQEVLSRDMHMLQHQTGAMVRMDMVKFNALMNENAVLTRELGKVQERSTRFLAEKNSEIARLNVQLMQLRAQGVAKDSRLAFLIEDFEFLKASIPDFDNSMRLQKRVDQMIVRQFELEEQNSGLRQKLIDVTKSLDIVLKVESSNSFKVNAVELEEPNLSTVHFYFKQKNVLCVGGRSGNIANYRNLIERVGGKFAHHDGGLEDNHSILDASLASADLVICQTGCISHNAYWKVKDFCKRTGKRCVFVENPSASSLVRGLEKISNHDSNVI